MGKIVVTEFISWTAWSRTRGFARTSTTAGGRSSSSRGDEGDQFKLDETMDSDAMLLGRMTYEGFAESWPGARASSPDKFNSCRSTSSPRRSPTRSGRTRP